MYPIGVSIGSRGYRGELADAQEREYEKVMGRPWADPEPEASAFGAPEMAQLDCGCDKAHCDHYFEAKSAHRIAVDAWHGSDAAEPFHKALDYWRKRRAQFEWAGGKNAVPLVALADLRDENGKLALDLKPTRVNRKPVVRVKPAKVAKVAKVAAVPVAKPAEAAPDTFRLLKAELKALVAAGGEAARAAKVEMERRAAKRATKGGRHLVAA